MKKPSLALLAALSLSASLFAEPAKLVKLWETTPVLKTPESVLVDPSGGVLYVANIDGKTPWQSDGQGSIGKVGLDGKVIAAEWVTGLDNPKGLGLHNGRLYVADMDHVVVIDVAKAAIAEKIAIAGAEWLNDITIDSSGVVYVSDSKTGKVHAITDGKPAVVLENLKDVNGLLAHQNLLYVLADGSFFERSRDGRFSKIADGIEGFADGIVRLEDGSFVISGWQGVVYHVLPNGEKHTLLDSRPAAQAADIGGDPKTRTLYIPTFFANTVTAYRID
jgi:sugar lactone lactonase YvrE